MSKERLTTHIYEVIEGFLTENDFSGMVFPKEFSAALAERIEAAIAERMPTEEEIRKEFPIGSTEKMKYNSDYAEQMKENQYKRLGAFWFRSRMEEKK